MYKSLSVRFLCLLALTARSGVALQREKNWLEIHITVPSTINKLRIWYNVFVKQPGLRMTGTAASWKKSIGNVPRPGNYMDTNLIKRTKKYCDKRFLDCVINLIPDSGSKALWSLIPFFWALSPFPSPDPGHILGFEPWAHIPCYDPQI